MKLLFLTLLAVALATAETQPGWWLYVPPNSTALMGVKWGDLKHSPLAAEIESEISASGGMSFPDLDCLRQARRIVIALPDRLAVAEGSFPAAMVEDQARRQSMERSAYRGVTLWLPPQGTAFVVAQIGDEMVLVGTGDGLRAALDGLHGGSGSLPSPLLPRAAAFSQETDLWVVARKLPDPLARVFVPLEIPASEFVGQVSLRDGLSAEAAFDESSEKAATEFAQSLREQASFNAAARGLEVRSLGSRVSVSLQMNIDQLLSALRSKAVTLRPIASGANLEATVDLPAQSAAPEPEYRFEVTHVEAIEPQIVRIFNLDEGTREIVLRPRAVSH